jgi:hypothetical protein
MPRVWLRSSLHARAGILMESDVLWALREYMIVINSATRPLNEVILNNYGLKQLIWVKGTFDDGLQKGDWRSLSHLTSAPCPSASTSNPMHVREGGSVAFTEVHYSELRRLNPPSEEPNPAETPGLCQIVLRLHDRPGTAVLLANPGTDYVVHCDG